MPPAYRAAAHTLSITVSNSRILLPVKGVHDGREVRPEELHTLAKRVRDHRLRRRRPEDARLLAKVVAVTVAALNAEQVRAHHV